MKNKVNEVLPWQVLSSVSSLYPFWQLHSKLPTVFRQKWSQPPLFTKHSSISAGNEQQRFNSWQQKCSLWQQLSRSGQEYRHILRSPRRLLSLSGTRLVRCVPSQTYLTRRAMGWAVEEIEVILSELQPTDDPSWGTLVLGNIQGSFSADGVLCLTADFNLRRTWIVLPCIGTIKT